MKGQNRAEAGVKLEMLLEAYGRGTNIDGIKSERPCVFISHSKEDTGACEPIAEYLMSAGIDVYFDKYDKTLSQLVDEGNPDKVTKRIQDGIDYSTHMLCVVSKATIRSRWGPFEVGYGYGKTALGVLTLKGVSDEELPEYMKTTRVIRGTTSLNEFLSELLSEPRARLEQRGMIRASSDLRHPLDQVLDWNK